jgi:uncharacterized protein (DUF2252 family)
MMARPDPIELGLTQLARDRGRKVVIPELVARKIAKVVVSPLAFLRGSAPLFYEMLAEHPELALGPAEAGHLCGDAHVENFGVYRTAHPKSKGGPVDPELAAFVFDVNDFDETIVGPWRFDVLRLLASLVLAGREFTASGVQIIGLSRALLAAYVGTAFLGRGLPEAPPPVARLLSKAEKRSARDVLDRRTQLVGNVRRFILGERYLALPKDLESKARAAFAEYVQSTSAVDLPRDHCDVVDLAFRVAGTGSLGTLRVAILARGKGGAEGGWLFDMKEERLPAAAPVCTTNDADGAERVVAGMRACLEWPPRMLGTTTLDGTRMLVRRLAPQEDKLDLTRIAKEELQGVAAFLGALLGRAHRRGATGAGTAPWSASDLDGMIDRAVTVAGVHEAAYLAYCKAVVP